MKTLTLKIISPNIKYKGKKQDIEHLILVNKLGIRLDESILMYLLQFEFKHYVEIKKDVLSGRIEERIKKISIDYDNKVNKMLDCLILNVDLERYSIDNLSKLVKSIMRVTKSLSSSLTSIVIGLEDIK